MPHDQRPRTPAPGSAEDPESQADSGGDDLEALAGALPSLAPTDAPSDADEEHDLGALAAVGGQRPSTELGEGDGRLSLATASADASASEVARSPSPTPPGEASRARPAWLLPLLLGLGIGAGMAGAAFVATSERSTQTSAAEGQTAVGLPTPAAQDSPATAQAGPTLHPPASVPAPAVEMAPAAGSAQAASAAPLAPASTPNAIASSRVGAAPATPRKSTPSVERDAESEEPAEPAAANTENPVLAVQPAADDPLAADKSAAPDANAKTASTVDALLDEALSPTARSNELARRQQAALEQEQVPVTPSREQITQAMTVLLPAIRGCAMGQSGLATAAIVVRADGRVAGVEITGAPFAGTPSGRCMEGVIRRARFTPFRQPVLRIKFPLAIQ